jgi:hypothetical protein
MNGSRSCQAARCTASRWLASVVAAAVVAAYPVTVAAEQRRDGVAGPASLATAAAVARSAVVTLKLPGRALVYGLLVDDWPDEEDLFERPAAEAGAPAI